MIFFNGVTSYTVHIVVVYNFRYYNYVLIKTLWLRTIFCFYLIIIMYQFKVNFCIYIWQRWHFNNYKQ